MNAAALKSMALFVWTRHRWLIVAAALTYLGIFAAYDMLWALEGRPLIMPALVFLTMTPFFLPLILFSSASSIATTDLASKDSAFPRFFFTLPVTARELVTAFMTCAVLLSALLWLVALDVSNGRVLLAGPLDQSADVLPRQAWLPLLWLALLVWTQAVLWMPFRRRWVRVVALLAFVAGFFVSLVLVLTERVAGSTIAAFSLLQLPLAYCVAVWGVARARRGDPSERHPRRGAVAPRIGRRITAHAVPSERQPRPRAERPAQSRAGQAFPSGLAAQSWFEWQVHRAHGKSPLFVLILLGAVVSVLGHVLLGDEQAADAASAVLQRTLGLVVLSLGFIGFVSGPAFASFQSNIQSHKGQAFVMPSFFAALPLSTGDFAWAKVKTAAKSMALVGTALLAAVAVITSVTGVHDSWAAFFEALRAQHGPLEAGALLTFAIVAFLLLIVAGSANVVWIALFGRAWNVVIGIIALVVLAIINFGSWIGRDPAALARAADLLPIVAAVKLGVLALLIYRVHARQLYSWARIVGVGAAWLAALALGLAVNLRYLPEGTVSASTALAALIVLLPVLGIFAAPLALQWNRCR